MGIRNASRLRQAACWASWADCLEMLQTRCPSDTPFGSERVGARFSEVPCIRSLRNSGRAMERAGSRSPMWESCSKVKTSMTLERGGAREPSSSRVAQGSISGSGQVFLGEGDQAFLDGTLRTLLRSQRTLSSVPFPSQSISRVSRLDSQVLRVVFPRHSPDFTQLLVWHPTNALGPCNLWCCPDSGPEEVLVGEHGCKNRQGSRASVYEPIVRFRTWTWQPTTDWTDGR